MFRSLPGKCEISVNGSYQSEVMLQEEIYKQVGKEFLFFPWAINVKLTHSVVYILGLSCNCHCVTRHHFPPPFPHLLAYIADLLCFLLSGS